jgi:hypothetical protein
MHLSDISKKSAPLLARLPEIKEGVPGREKANRRSSIAAAQYKYRNILFMSKIE